MMQANFVLDAKGLACPMPIVRTKKKMNELEAGQVLEIQATDKGSTADLQAWAKSTGHEYLGTEAAGDVLHHFAAGLGFDFPGDLVQVFLLAAADDNLRAGARVGLRDGVADITGAAENQGDFTFKRETRYVHVLLLFIDCNSKVIL